MTILQEKTLSGTRLGGSLVEKDKWKSVFNPEALGRLCGGARNPGARTPAGKGPVLIMNAETSNEMTPRG